MGGGECAWVCVAERGVCVVGRVCCASVNSKAGNCRTCVIAFQPTIQRVVCLLLFLRVIVIVNCTVTLLSTHTHTHTAVYCMLFFWWASPFNWQTLQPAARLRLKLKTFWTPPPTPTHCLRHVAAVAQLAADSCRNICPGSARCSDSACHIREGKSKTSNSRDFTIYLYVF